MREPRCSRGTGAPRPSTRGSESRTSSCSETRTGEFRNVGEVNLRPDVKIRVRTLSRPFLVVAVLLAAIPVLSTEQAKPRRLEVNYSQFTLPNGLNVILHEDHTVPFVCVDVWYHVGSAREKPGRTGFAHLFEHIMFEGSRNVKKGDFDRLLEAA